MVSPETRGPREHTCHCAPRRPHHHCQGHWPKQRAQHGYQAPPVGRPHKLHGVTWGTELWARSPWSCRLAGKYAGLSTRSPGVAPDAVTQDPGETSWWDECSQQSRTPRAQEPRGLGPVRQDQLPQEKGVWARGLKETLREERAPRFWAALPGFQLRSRLKSCGHCPGPLALPEPSFVGRLPGCPPLREGRQDKVGPQPQPVFLAGCRMVAPGAGLSPRSPHTLIYLSELQSSLCPSPTS